MTVIIALLIADTIMQLVFCHISLWWLISLVCRILFCCRVIGATFQAKKLAIGEGVALACMLLFYIMFSKNGVPWLRLILNILFTGISVVLMYLDDLLYVYVIEDVDD